MGVNLRHPPTRTRGGALIVERTENPMWLSNAYLVADPERGRYRLLFTVRDFLLDDLRARERERRVRQPRW